MKRREMLAGIGASVLFAGALSAEDDSDKKKAVEYLFVQKSESVSLKDGVLTLGKVDPSTLYFSDRPDRIVGQAPTSKVIDHWGVGNDNFESDPPNATLAIAGDKEPTLLVVVLMAPRLEGDNLVYDVKVLEGDKTIEGGECSLFIDIIGMPRTPFSYAGAARRGVRRSIYRY